MHSIDFTLVVVYLLFTLIVALWSSKKITTLKEYAVGKHSYPTIMLVTIICTTCLSGSATFSLAELVYRHGIIYIFIFAIQSISLLLIAYIFAPRLNKFQQQCISVGDIMVLLYGKKSGIITGIVGVVISTGFVSAQIKAMSFMLTYFVGIKSIAGVVISSLITVIYSTIGGIRAITLTSIVQFIAITVAIPLILSIGIDVVGGYGELINRIPEDKLEANISATSIKQYLPLMIYCAIPTFLPPIMQQILMARDTNQVINSFKIVAVIMLVYNIIVGIIGLVAFVLHKDLATGHAILYIVDQYLPFGMKAIAIIGILSIIMSTADSYLNAGAVTLVHDTIKPLLNISDIDELHLTRLITCIIGIFAIYMAISFESIIDSILFAQQFWGPMIAIPLIIGILNYKVYPAAIYSGMASGLILPIIWRTHQLERFTGVSIMIPSCLLSAIFIFSTNKYINYRNSQANN